jgi:hypothetical protein
MNRTRRRRRYANQTQGASYRKYNSGPRFPRRASGGGAADQSPAPDRRRRDFGSFFLIGTVGPVSPIGGGHRNQSDKFLTMKRRSKIFPRNRPPNGGVKQFSNVSTKRIIDIEPPRDNF